MKIIEKDILDVPVGVIGHQVNCLGVMGSGLAKQIKDRFPVAWKAYYSKKDWKVGDIQVVKVGASLYVANLAGQDRLGLTRQQTNYRALAMCLSKLSNWAQAKQLPIYLPFGLGCGLGGGKWQIVEPIIEKICPNAIICRLPVACDKK